MSRANQPLPALRYEVVRVPDAVSTRSVTADSPLSKASSLPMSCGLPNRRSGCISRSPRNTSPIRPGIPNTRGPVRRGGEFPYRSWDLNYLAFHPDLVDGAERYLGTPDLHLYKVELWAKYGGAANYDQPLHRDYGSHSLVVPRLDGGFQQLTTFIYLSDVTADDGPTRIVPFERGKEVPFTPLYLDFGDLADGEVSAVGPAGSLFVYRTDILHRGSDITGAGHLGSRSRDFQARGTTWGGKMAWPKQSPQRWAKLIPRARYASETFSVFRDPATTIGTSSRWPTLPFATRGST